MHTLLTQKNATHRLSSVEQERKYKDQREIWEKSVTRTRNFEEKYRKRERKTIETKGGNLKSQ